MPQSSLQLGAAAAAGKEVWRTPLLERSASYNQWHEDEEELLQSK